MQKHMVLSVAPPKRSQAARMIQCASADSRNAVPVQAVRADKQDAAAKAESHIFDSLKEGFEGP